MLESLFIRIVVTMVFPFIATAYMTDRALHRRFPLPMTMLMWVVAFIASFWICHVIIDHAYGITDEIIFGPIYERSVQVTTLVCVSTFTAAWTAVTCTAYRGTPSSRIMTAFVYATLCCEELAANVSRHAPGSDPDRTMDIVVRAGTEPSMIIRDDGPLFNPMTFDGEGIWPHVARGMCGSMTYSRAMGQNNVRITFRG